jgi:hypothetical protein
MVGVGVGGCLWRAEGGLQVHECIGGALAPRVGGGGPLGAALPAARLVLADNTEQAMTRQAIDKAKRRQRQREAIYLLVHFWKIVCVIYNILYIQYIFNIIAVQCSYFISREYFPFIPALLPRPPLDGGGYLGPAVAVLLHPLLQQNQLQA